MNWQSELQLSTLTDVETQLVHKFDAAWRNGDSPNAERFLNKEPLSDSSNFNTMLWFLLLVEMSHRICRGEESCVGSLLKQYPTIANDKAAAARLIAAEYNALISRDATPLADNFQARFAEYSDELRSHLPSGTDTLTYAFDASQLTDTFSPSSERRPPKSQPHSIAGYDILKEIARGGMGVVYKALQEQPRRVVALKCILAGALATKDAIQRFLGEADAAANLDHPGIVPIYEVGQHDDGYFYTMGYVDGHSLADLLKEGPLPPRRASEILLHSSNALAYAHHHGVIHRDLKPANILLDDHGMPRITDFGLAKRVDANSELTATGQVMGTPSYMPPEQASGRLKNVGPAADIYSLGATLYCMLTGRPPFQAANVAETLKQVLDDDPVSPRSINPSIDRDVETICLKCLEKTVHRRYATAEDLHADLERYLDGRPIHARPVSGISRAVRWCRRKPATAALITALLIAMLSGTTLSTYFGMEAAASP